LSKGGCPTEDLGHDGLRDKVRKYFMKSPII